jgi:hypothetical protein
MYARPKETVSIIPHRMVYNRIFAETDLLPNLSWKALKKIGDVHKIWHAFGCAILIFDLPLKIW